VIVEIMKKRLLIIGAGGHGRAIAEAVLLENKYSLTAFLDDAVCPSANFLGYPIWGATEILESCRGRIDFVFVAIGKNDLRMTLHERICAEGMVLATIIHPSAIISPTATVGQGCAIMARAVVGAGALLGEGVIVNCGAVIDHDCIVQSFGHLSVNAAMAGGSVLGHRAWMRVNSALDYGVKLPAGHVLRAGETLHG